MWTLRENSVWTLWNIVWIFDLLYWPARTICSAVVVPSLTDHLDSSLWHMRILQTVYIAFRIAWKFFTILISNPKTYTCPSSPDTSYYFKIKFINNLLYEKTLREVTQYKNELFNSHYLHWWLGFIPIPIDWMKWLWGWAGVASCWLCWRVVKEELFWLPFWQAKERPIRTMIMLNTMPYISSQRND